MDENILSRKGPRKIEDISEEVLVLLNKGELETVNLTEWLGIDQIELVEHTFPSLGLTDLIGPITKAVGAMKNPSAMNIIKEVGAIVSASRSDQGVREAVFKGLSEHLSDTVRSYATFLPALNTNNSIDQKLEQSKGLIADHHFGVREIVWIALRPHIEESLEKSIEILSQWTSNEDENIRRFTTECTRPRGVWCKHIEELKQHPALAQPILEPLRSDPAVYVQNSVGNWLNDASKTQPAFVSDICDRWTAESPTKETQKIVKRARRTLDKK